MYNFTKREFKIVYMWACVRVKWFACIARVMQSLANCFGKHNSFCARHFPHGRTFKKLEA